VPQTIQSRGQFGFYGTAFLFPCVLLLNVGFIAAQLVIQAQSLQGVAGSLSIPAWIGILVIPAVIIGIFGYRWIHRVMQVTAVVVGVSLVVMFVQGLEYGSLPARETTMTAPPVGLFLAGVALLVIDMLSFGPFVSDYSRYLPADTSGRRLCRSSPSRTTPARWSGTWAGPTSPGWSVGSSRPASTCCSCGQRERPRSGDDSRPGPSGCGAVAHASTTGHPFSAVVKVQRAIANTAAAAAGRVQPQATPFDTSRSVRTNSHITTSIRMTRTVIRTGRLYSQERTRARWMRGRVCRVARVGRVSVTSAGV
jgi:hypothetical protein